jgi:hypothetical protein
VGLRGVVGTSFPGLEVTAVDLFVDLDHWHLVLDECVRSAVAEWLVSRGST